MPDFALVPVDHDPFAGVDPSLLSPAESVPFSRQIGDTDQLRRFMTHQPEAPNPAAPYLQAARDFARGGISGVVRGRGAEMPAWSNQVGDVLTSEPANWAIGMATPLKGAGTIAKAAEETAAASPSFQAYHGSPHDFDRFDLSRIGTGEGAQAYGHGLYFAEEPAVARGYREALTRTSGNAALDWAERNPEIAKEARQQLEAHSRAIGIKTAPDDNLFALMLTSTKEGHPPDAFSPELSEQIKQTWEKPPGRMYQVSIKADPEHFLDWDKPLSEQPQAVRDALDKWNPMAKDARNPDFHLHQMVRSKSGAEALRSAGIPGIKYLDQGSRAAGEGSRNYVVFDDKLVDIIKKYGLAGMIGGGAYHFQHVPVDHDPFADVQ